MDPELAARLKGLSDERTTERDAKGQVVGWKFSPRDKAINQWLKENYGTQPQRDQRVKDFLDYPETADLWLDRRGFICPWRNPREDEKSYIPFPTGEEKVWGSISPWGAKEGPVVEIEFSVERPGFSPLKERIESGTVRKILRNMITLHPKTLFNHTFLCCMIVPEALAWKEAYNKMILDG